MIRVGRIDVDAADEPVRIVGDRLSRRVKVTALAGSAFAFFEMNTRPVWVAAHSVEVLLAVRSTATTYPPARSPQTAPVRRVAA